MAAAAAADTADTADTAEVVVVAGIGTGTAVGAAQIVPGTEAADAGSGGDIADAAAGLREPA